MSPYKNHAYRHGIGWSTWHFEWCTKFRYKVFEDGELQKLCEALLLEAARRYNFQIMEFEVDVDHVHVIAKLRLSMSPAKAIMLMKGYTSRVMYLLAEEKLRKYYWPTKRHNLLWGDGKFMASVGHITLEKAKQYVSGHAARHAKTYNGNPHPLGLGSIKSKK